MATRDTPASSAAYTYTREDFGEALELLLDCWNQWAYEGNGGKKWHGGLSTLEWLDEYLTRMGVEHG